MGGGSARFGFWALVLHVLFAWFYAVSCFGSGGVRYRSFVPADYSSVTSGVGIVASPLQARGEATIRYFFKTVGQVCRLRC